MRPRPTLFARERSRALRELRGSEEVARVEAAKKLACDPSAFPDLRKLLRVEQSAVIRHAIVFALTWHDDLRSWPILVRLLTDKTESPLVRGQAAEGLAYLFHRKRRERPDFRAGVDALVVALSDPSPEVRYFAAFALGAAGDASTLHVLNKLTEDRARPAGFVGTVGDEAKAAIQRLSPLRPDTNASSPQPEAKDRSRVHHRRRSR